MKAASTFLFIIFSFLFACQGTSTQAVLKLEIPAQTISFPRMTKVVQPEFLDQFNKGAERVKVIVLLKGFKDFNGLPVAGDTTGKEAFQSSIRSRQDKVLNVIDPRQFQLKHRFENIPGFSGEATLEGIKQLATMDDVEVIEEDKEMVMDTPEGTSMKRKEEK